MENIIFSLIVYNIILTATVVHQRHRLEKLEITIERYHELIQSLKHDDSHVWGNNDY